ncbi:hypothetical protein N431DRAFT_431604 [Stipitochalara longipes BDJ]|nr:hypothetical protein N431DRAFT_431604 [Stipitochalara longipes BDJ]
MATVDPLESSVQLSPISIETKCEILNHLWGVTVRPSQYYTSDFDFDTYFSYYTAQCNDALHDGGRHVSVRTHRDVIKIAQDLKNSHTRDAVKSTLASKMRTPRPANEDEILDGSIDLVLRLLLMIEFGHLQYGFTGRKQLVWDSNSLEDFVHGYFNTPRALGQETVKLEKIFNARNLGRIAGMAIEWTDNLADHLRLTDGDKKVAIFHHASFLECQLKSPLFPDGLIEETMRTLALLFPQSDRATQKWFTSLSSSSRVRQRLDNKASKSGRLRADDRHIANFPFWHDQLVILKQVFDEAEPSNLSQWWCDRRKRVQWYTFWVALLVLALTVFFGLVQCIEGGLQVYKAYHPS